MSEYTTGFRLSENMEIDWEFNNMFIIFLRKRNSIDINRFGWKLIWETEHNTVYMYNGRVSTRQNKVVRISIPNRPHRFNHSLSKIPF